MMQRKTAMRYHLKTTRLAKLRHVVSSVKQVEVQWNGSPGHLGGSLNVNNLLKNEWAVPLTSSKYKFYH